MKGFVLDCSVAMTWCFEDEANTVSDSALGYLKEYKAFVPNIWSLEIINVLRVGEKRNRITATQSNMFINLINALPIEIDHPFCDPVNRNIADISRDYSISAYDAAYLELAIRKELPLFSFDKLLCEAAAKAGILINRLR